MKPLIETNPYLRNKEHREASNRLSTRSSCGVEGIVVSSSSEDFLIGSSRTKKALEKIRTRVKGRASS